MDLHLKYRPKTLDQIIGQEEIVKSIKNLFQEDKVPHSFLFTGPSGTGKTTIARILGNMLDVAEIVEIDGATFTGVDDMRSVAENLKYPSMMGNGKKLLILDEAHMLSKNSWNSWLKTIEEPPSHAYIVLCTTEYEKVIPTIKTRCHTYKLNTLSEDDIQYLVDDICEKEGITLPKYGSALIAKESNGSARQAVVTLSQVSNCQSLPEISSIIGLIDDESPVYELCKFLAKGGTSLKLGEILTKVKGTNPYSIKLSVMNYLTSCILRSKTDNDRLKFLSMLEDFNGVSMDSNTGFSEIVLASFNTIIQK